MSPVANFWYLQSTRPIGLLIAFVRSGDVSMQFAECNEESTFKSQPHIELIPSN
jgi:hypothetical protein